MSKKTLEVSLLGQSYKLVTDDSEDHVFKSARFVDGLVHDIESAGVKDREKAILLASLQLASRLIKSEQACLEVRSDIDGMHGWAQEQLIKLSSIL